MDNLNIKNTPNMLKKPKLNFAPKRLNKKPLFFIGFFIIVLLFGLGYAAAHRSKSNEMKDNNEKRTLNSDSQNQLNSMIDDISKVTPKKETTKYTLNAPGKENENDPLGLQVTDYKEVGFNQNQIKPLAGPDKALEEYKKRYINALNAQTRVRLDSSIYQNNNQRNNQPFSGTLVAQQDQSDTRNSLQSEVLKGILSQNKETNNDERNEPFLNKSNRNSDYLTQQKQPLKSPYELKAGAVLPGVMITGINSDLPGQILGMVSENVFDTATGQYLLIPQGSKLVGIYSANVIYGQERVLIAWNRVIFPDGKYINLGTMPGTDQAGYSGFTDEINNHYVKIFGSAFMMSLISAGVALTDDSGNRFTESSKDKVVSGFVQQLGEVGQQMIRKNLNISPTLEIRPGYRFNIFITKDMILEPLSY